jgi:hypothetical protein
MLPVNWPLRRVTRSVSFTLSPRYTVTKSTPVSVLREAKVMRRPVMGVEAEEVGTRENRQRCAFMNSRLKRSLHTQRRPQHRHGSGWGSEGRGEQKRVDYLVLDEKSAP